MRALRIRAKRWWPDWRTWPARAAVLAGVPMPLRLAILRAVGHTFGPKSRVRTGSLVTGSRLRAGEDVFINAGCHIDAHDEVRLDDRAGIGQGVQILTEDHELGSSRCRYGRMNTKPVHVGAGAWIGAGCILLPGTVVGEGAVVAAGAVTRGTLEANTLHAGVPARAIRALSPDAGG